MRVARFLVQGVDVWLNNPRRPLEASGTSGMKAAQNGVPNVSVLDGWWDEGFEGDNGWAIGGRETDPDEAAQDWRDAQDLYRLLEERDRPGLLRARRGRPAARAGWRSCAGRWPARCGGSRRRGCSTSTRSALYLPGGRRCRTRRRRPASSPPPSSPKPADARRDGAAHLAGARDPQPPAGRQLRLGLRRGLRAGLPADGRGARAAPRRPAVAPLHRAAARMAARRAAGVHRPARARSSRATRSRSWAVATTSRSSPRCRSATGSASCAGWATSSRRCSASGRSAPGWPSVSGSRTCRRRWPPAGYDWTVLDDAHFRAAAIPEEDLWGPYTTEDQGQLLTRLRHRAGPPLPDPVPRRRGRHRLPARPRHRGRRPGRDDGRRRREVRGVADDLGALLGRGTLGRPVLRGARGERATG